jgi:Fungal specific transcription factor domain
MLSYETGNLPDKDAECLRRIFWSCYILERFVLLLQALSRLEADLYSDYLAELTALPQFGISEMESSVALPGAFDTHEDHSDGSLSSLYFLACISMRRLLNRAHHLLFEKDTGAMFDGGRLSGMVDELNDQLNQWKELLPPALQFSIDTQPVDSQQGSFLRQRFLVCKA